MLIDEVISEIWGKNWKDEIQPKKVVPPFPKTKSTEIKILGKTLTPHIFLSDNYHEIEYPNVDNRDIRSYKRKILKHGIDVLAFYRPYHSDPHNWGIYILDKGVDILVNAAFGQSFAGAKRYGKEWAYSILVDHEYFHFLTELAYTILEAASGFHVNFHDYHNLKIKDTYTESLANAYSFNRFIAKQEAKLTFKMHKGLWEYDGLYNFMKNQPPWYNEFDKYLDEKDFNLGLRKIVSNVSSMKNNEFTIPSLEILFDKKETYVNQNDVPKRVYSD